VSSKDTDKYGRYIGERDQPPPPSRELYELLLRMWGNHEDARDVYDLLQRAREEKDSK
jgi:hypothetical protein